MSVPAVSVPLRIARVAWVCGFVSAGLAVIGSMLVQPASAVDILRIGTMAAIGFGVLGLVTGLMSRAHPAGRFAAVASAALLVIVVLFLGWSWPVTASTSPA